MAKLLSVIKLLLDLGTLFLSMLATAIKAYYAYKESLGNTQAVAV